ncbi:MAG: (d)CMP kinase [Bifidobacteriaceae bacterium]|jgi:cytidylate kinase|nr:(d)CMP kinase [Bifidobacteriaceae bacterium]
MAGIAIAIDGPSGSGKSSVAREVAQHLALAYLDTGAMYRAATVWALRSGVSLGDTGRVAHLVRTMPLRICLDPAAPGWWLAGDDIAQVIRDPAVSAAVSQLATNLDARPLLIEAQRGIVATERVGGWSRGRGVVAEGRDITTVVAPDAEVRILVVASEAARLARRAVQLHGRTDPHAVAATRASVVDRDAADSTVAEFMTAADGVTVLDNTDLTLDQTVRAVLDLVEERAR